MPRIHRSALGIDAMKSTRAIRMKVETPEEINEVFDGIAYEKTAAVLRMIEKPSGGRVSRVSPRTSRSILQQRRRRGLLERGGPRHRQAGRSHHAQLRGPGRRAGADRPQLVRRTRANRRQGRPLHGHARLVTGSADVDAARGLKSATARPVRADRSGRADDQIEGAAQRSPMPTAAATTSPTTPPIPWVSSRRTRPA